MSKSKMLEFNLIDKKAKKPKLSIKYTNKEVAEKLNKTLKKHFKGYDFVSNTDK